MTDLVINYFDDEVHIERQKMVCFNCGLIKVMEFEFDPSDREYVRNESEVKRFKNLKELTCPCPDCYSKAQKYKEKGGRYKKTVTSLEKYGIMRNLLKKCTPFDLFKSVTQLKNTDQINYNKNDILFVLMYMSNIEELESFAIMAAKWFGYTQPDNIIKILEKMIPKKFYFSKSKRSSKKMINMLDKVSNYFKISIQEAKEYMNFISEQDKMDEFIELFDEDKYVNKK
jgi:hypothetical protein